MIETRNLWPLIAERAAATPDAVMATDEQGRTITFAQLMERSERAAAGLHQMGIAERDVVSWQLPTWIESIVLVGALSRLGVVQNPVIPIYREREVGSVLRQAASKLFITPGTWKGFDYQAMGSAIGVCDVLVVDRDLPDGDPAVLPGNFDAADEVRWLFSTSGTTAEPKVARHTDLTVSWPALGMIERLKLTEADRNALVFPFTHIGGIIWLFSGLMAGFTNIIDEAFVPDTTIGLLQRNDVTVAGAGTFFHMAYLAAQRAKPDTKLFPKARVFPGGGAAKPAGLHDDVKRELGGVGICAGYGLTEAPILCMTSVDDTDAVKASTEGRPIEGVTLRFVDGEIRAKAPQIMKGYLDEQLTDEAFDEDGWFRTGDLGELDDHGAIVITGRVKDIIIRKGENISAKEVEDLLFDHPKVADVAVIGLPDPEAGERACAVVVAKAPLVLSELTDHLRAKGLRTHALPERLELVDVLPRNPTGKVLKYDLRARYASANAR